MKRDGGEGKRERERSRGMERGRKGVGSEEAEREDKHPQFLRDGCAPAQWYWY